MNIKILNFIREIKQEYNLSCVYEVSVWERSHIDKPQLQHRIGVCLSGFDGVYKETEDELIQSFDLIRKLLAQLTAASNTKKQLNTKLLN